MNQKIVEEMIEIIQRENLWSSIQKMDQFYHHGQVTTMWHCIAVAYFSMKIAQLIRLKIHRKSMIVGALFHDYYLYDWHVAEPFHRFHGFKHGKFALNNIKKTYSMNPIEEDIILKHMFPLTFHPPKYRESILVSIIDKGCSIGETVFKDSYQELKHAFYHLNSK